VDAYVKEIERYNRCMHESGAMGEDLFFAEIEQKHPEFEAFSRKA
jgi:stage V sporulation protein R